MSDDETRSRPSEDNPFDAWLASAPRASTAGLCPWCSAPVDPPALATCPACGAQLQGSEAEEIPGVTVVDAGVVARRATARRPPGGLGFLAWLTGDEVLADAVSEAAIPAVAASAAPAAIGPESPGAVAPPDERVRREMRRMLAGDDVPGDDATGAPGGDAADAPDLTSPSG